MGGPGSPGSGGIGGIGGPGSIGIVQELVMRMKSPRAGFAKLRLASWQDDCGDELAVCVAAAVGHSCAADKPPRP
jgi:hypothetical protein